MALLSEMTLIERLRYWAGSGHNGVHRDQDIAKAADELERLQADLATFGKDTEATENRIIDAEFAKTEACNWLKACLGMVEGDGPPNWDGIRAFLKSQSV